ncbi:MAG: hypothetical protein QOI38_30 [Sphingomonadales bacterium]|jgi:hypothetical protein|nr:hypothetical protein [Sphingomonadales bacterium]
MTERTASCRCGALTAVARGEPVRVSVCHCLACKRRTGSAFSYNAHWPEDQVETRGAASRWRRTNAEGFWCAYEFCPVCGSTVVYRIERRPGLVSIPVGAFADPDFPEPAVSVFGQSRHGWCVIETDGPLSEM